MTAISAPSANGTPSTANSIANVAEIRLPGSDRTYEARNVLRGIGLKWDPATHAWHGRLLAAQRAFLERRYGLATKVVVPIEAFERPAAEATAVTSRPRPPAGPRGPPHDYSSSCMESRIAFPGADEDAEEIAAPTRRFTLAEITSGLSDDSREEDEREGARRLRDLRGRVKAARAVVARMPGLAEVLPRDWRKTDGFYVRFGISEAQFRNGIPASLTCNGEVSLDFPGKS